jgi:hypothetical protein
MILKILGSIIVFSTYIFANVQLIAPNEFIQGDAVVFSIKASGEDIEFPIIANIDGFDVQKNGSTNNITIINGKRSENRIQSYQFFPNKSVTLPPFGVKINSQTKYTKEHKIKLSKIKKSNSKLYDISIKIDKKKVYVSEDIKLTLTFKYAKNANIVDIGFTDPVFDNFWSKQYGKLIKYEQNQYIVQELTYLLFPQKDGKLTINPVKIDLVLQNPRDPFSFLGQGINKRIYSNQIEIEAMPLPNGIKLIGDFKITTKVNHTKVKSGQAVAYSINIEGRGNIDDLDDIKLNIDNVTIYENKAQKSYDVDTKGRYGGTYSKNFSIVSSNDFTIPSISIKYFDKKTKKIKTIKTKSYDIKVEGSSANNTPKQVKLQKLETKPKVKEKIVVKTIDTTTKDKVIFFIFGMVIMLFLVFVYIYISRLKSSKKDIELPLQKKVKKLNNQEQLLKLLVVYLGKNKKLDEIIYELENSTDIDIKKVKKQILLILKDLKL